MSKRVVPPIGEEDEFRGLGDDLFGQETPKESVVPVKKGPRPKMTRRQKALRVMIKRAGIKSPPTIERILEGKTGPKIPISEIGFITNDIQSDVLMAELAQECHVRNRLNRDDILLSRILAVGSEIFKAGRMWTPFYIHQDIYDGRYECISGRHRLAFLALVYGSNLEVPVYIEHLTLKSAREAVTVANDSRPVKALERASYAILRASGGDSEADQDKIYNRLSNLKTNMTKYCVYSVIERGFPAKFTFKLSERSSRPDGGITTVSNIEVFWSEALYWQVGMERKDLDSQLGDSVKFLNLFVSTIRKIPGFNPDQHLTANVLAAVGKYYLAYPNPINDVRAVNVPKLSKVVVALGHTVKKQVVDIYNSILADLAKV